MRAMLKLNSVVLRRGHEVLLENASATIVPGRRVGLIGPNGCGKTSLFKLLLGELSTDAGDLTMPKQWRLSHMAQEVSSNERAAVDFVIDGDFELRQLQAAIQALEDSGKNDEQAHLALARHYADLESIGGYQANTRAEQLLHGLGFQQTEITKPAASFSGGWRIRLNLAQALMCPSDLLLLDEPTNHLDLDATLWLEQWLKAYRGTLLLISHDRDFLDNVVGEMLSIENNELFNYRGNYSAYERQRAERLAQQQSLFLKQQQRVAQINSFVTRFRAKATKARQAQSRLKELERMELIAPAHIDSPFQFCFFEAEKMSNPLLNLQASHAGYGDQTILSNINLNLHPGSRIGLLGINGAGKSTLVKTLVGMLPLLAGERVCGEHLALGYFAQHQLEALDLDASALLHVQRITPTATEQSIRDFLGGFDFYGDKVLSPVRPFSGGEKARLALALIVWQKPNVLLLDEPTNHLDLEMRQALTLALQEYSGALIVISHDRYLLRNTVDEFYLVADAKVQPFDGDLDDYYQWLQKQNKKNDTDLVDASQGNPEKLDKKAQRQQAAEVRAQLQPVTKRLRAVEATLQQTQVEFKRIEAELSSADLYQTEHKNRLQVLLQQQTEQKKILIEQEGAWLELQEQLEELEKIVQAGI